jgi:hypothetical protein
MITIDKTNVMNRYLAITTFNITSASKPFIIILLMVQSGNLFGQKNDVYTQEYLDKSTRFAWLTYGADLNFLSGGSTEILINNSRQPASFGSTIFPRLTIGGIHFWGHVDFYVSFPLSFLTIQDTPSDFEELNIYQGIETGTRIYPLKLQENRLSPFVGVSFRRMRFAQELEGFASENGVPGYGRFIYPLQLGLTYTTSKWHISASAYYNFQNDFDYFISPTETARVEMDPLSFNLSLLRYIDSDRQSRNPGAAERANRDYNLLKESNLLSTWFFGVGPSSALQITKSPYLRENFPFFYDEYSAALLPDLTFGRYFNKPDANINVSYRTYGEQYEGFDSEISTRRHSVGVESVKFLFNYLGFVPFAGPIVSYESLRTTVNGTAYTDNKLAMGVTFGWDIRVTRTGSGLLRTNLRYYPNLHMNIEGEKMMFDHLEFNFIQWVQFIGRKKALRG